MRVAIRCCITIALVAFLHPLNSLPETRDPSLALWRRIRDALLVPDGQRYFETHMKWALVPDGADGVRFFDATLIAAEPDKKPNKLFVSVGVLGDHRTSDAILRLKTKDGHDLQLDRKPKLATRLEFEGIATEFSTDPFMVTFDVQRTQIKGLQFENSHR
jgi:hypothetical protein